MQAQVALLRARLNYVEAAEHHLTTDRTKEGTVAMQDPGAGSEVVARTPVRVMLYVYSPQSGGTGKIGESK